MFQGKDTKIMMTHIIRIAKECVRNLLDDFIY